jgi:hypothetical protein
MSSNEDKRSHDPHSKEAHRKLLHHCMTYDGSSPNTFISYFTSYTPDNIYDFYQ